jgi:hypothetical protein
MIRAQYQGDFVLTVPVIRKVDYVIPGKTLNDTLTTSGKIILLRYRWPVCFIGLCQLWIGTGDGKIVMRCTLFFFKKA